MVAILEIKINIDDNKIVKNYKSYNFNSRVLNF